MKKFFVIICIALFIMSCQSESTFVNPVNQWVKVTSFPLQSGNNALFLKDTLIITDTATAAVFYKVKKNETSFKTSNASFGHVESFVSYGGGLYCVSMGNAVNYSGDFCRTWVQKNNGLPNTISISDLVATDIGLYVCGNGLYYSNDNGDSWKDISIQGINTVLSVVYLDRKLIASTNKGFYISGDNGAQWVKVNLDSDISNASITKFAVIDNAIYAASGIVANSTVYASFDKGNTWRKSSGLDVLGSNSFYAFESYNGALYVASKHGVFESVDNARHWVYSGCDDSRSFARIGNVLYVGTASRGLWLSALERAN